MSCFVDAFLSVKLTDKLTGHISYDHYFNVNLRHKEIFCLH